jgi:hypothetical protein
MLMSLARPALAHPGQRAHQRETDVGTLRLLHLLHRVAPRDVTDLVGKDAGQFTHVGRPLDQPAIDVHPTTRDREGVDFPAVDDREVPRETSRVVPQRLGAERGDVVHDRVADREAGRDIRSRTGAEFGCCWEMPQDAKQVPRLKEQRRARCAGSVASWN